MRGTSNFTPLARSTRLLHRNVVNPAAPPRARHRSQRLHKCVYRNGKTKIKSAAASGAAYFVSVAPTPNFLFHFFVRDLNAEILIKPFENDFIVNGALIVNRSTARSRAPGPDAYLINIFAGPYGKTT
jgi:hypothetical protein